MPQIFKYNFCKTAGLTALLLWFCFLTVISSCKKLVAIDPPTNTITTTEVFSDSVNADAALNGIYGNMINTHQRLNLTSGGLSIYGGESSDEYLNFYGDDHFSLNTMDPTDGNSDIFWNPAYQLIYQANAAIEATNASAGISQGAKDQFVGEAEFLRSFLYFYLTNLFGDIPYITSTDYKSNSTASNTSQAEIYKSIITDLTDAQSKLRSDYSYSGNNRTRANRYAATALLARAYLYTHDWVNAEKAATEVISNPDFGLEPDPTQSFLINSKEAILQLGLNPAYFPYNATFEGLNVIPYDSTLNPPLIYIRQELLNAFEPTDLRRSSWVDSTDYNGTYYYYPFKYRVGPAQTQPNGTVTEYCVVLRFAEQFLIRAEARIQQGKQQDALDDINIIRSRATLPPTSASTNDEILAAIDQERRIELFGEWAHRWLDLKRRGTADAVLGALKPTWRSFQQLYPIPHNEIVNDPFLKQNPGY